VFIENLTERPTTSW